MTKNHSFSMINRRAVLRGAGVACALPFLPSLAQAKTPQGKAPKRMCFLYFPNGCSLPEISDKKNAPWRWFPHTDGEDYKFTNVLNSLEKHRQDISIMGGLSHPKSRELLGHIAGDTWLTAGDLRGGEYLNSISVDQIAARYLKDQTRYPSLTLSVDGGVGYKSRVSTLSFSETGRPIPSEYRHRSIFERYFSAGGAASEQERRRTLEKGKKIVDLIMEDGKSLQPKLSQEDRYKLDEYMTSLNSIEEQIKRNESWLTKPMKEFSSDHINFDVSGAIDPNEYIRSMLDLIVLAYEIDLTRVATYMMAREDGMGIGDAFPKVALGLKSGHHTISHSKEENRYEQWGKYDQWMASHFAYFIERLKDVKDENGPLLDSTMVVYGSACSTTHDAINCPTILAGGTDFGIKHGAYSIYDEKHHTLSDLYLGMLNKAEIPVQSFGDSTAPLPLFA